MTTQDCQNCEKLRAEIALLMRTIKMLTDLKAGQ